MQLLQGDFSGSGKADIRASRFFPKNKIVFMLVIAGVLSIGALLMHVIHPTPPLPQSPAGSRQTLPDGLAAVTSLPYPDTLEEILHSEEGSTLRLVPPAELKLASDNLLGLREVMLTPFYISESPITNQQYVGFLNKNIDKIKILENGVYLDGRLLLQIGEKMRRYKPIGYENGVFSVQEAMHSACAVLMVTGFGAEAYAEYFGMRLPRPEEWYYILKTGGNPVKKRLELPTPVMNYPQDKYGLRGINQLSEWGKTREGGFAVSGIPASVRREEAGIPKREPAEYYVDTSFRVIKDAPGHD